MHPDDDPPERVPRLNPDLFGHAEAEAAFLAAWNSGRMPHAWLLAGPRGIGKATLAYRMARFVLAGGGQGGGLFGAPDSLAMAPDDRVFQRVAALGHSDLRVIRRSKNKTGKWRQDISIEDVRDMGAFLRLTAGEGAWRVAIIDSADEMTRQAANAALKVVEEPPPRALILLVSHAPGRLLPTIRSRCRRLALRPLDDAVVKRIVTKHHPELPADELDVLARLAEGSAGRALALVDHGGVELHRAMLAMLSGFPRVDGLVLDKLSDRLGRAGAEEGFRVFGEMLTNLLARLCRDQKAGRLAGGASNDPEAPVARALGAAAGLDRWLQVWEKLAELFARAESAKLDRKQVVVDAVLTLAQAARNRA
ncbi:MAG: DNA polymerase III subunit delta' [Alphaproteobacteria bacterium]|nr:DNA polymerase III subunit delta' [Alphaproteobacteria bacterium]